MLTGAGGLDRRIEGQQVGLLRDRGDHLGDLPDLFALMRQQPHGLVGLPNHGGNLLHGVGHPRQRGLPLSGLLLHLLGTTCRGGDIASHIPGADRHLIDSRRHRIDPPPEPAQDLGQFLGAGAFDKARDDTHPAFRTGAGLRLGLGIRALLVDARPPRFFSGEARVDAAARYGTLPGAKSFDNAQFFPQGGTTLKDFTRADGRPGYFVQELQVYGRAGQACVRCGHPLEELRQGQRTTVYCRLCQR